MNTFAQKFIKVVFWVLAVLFGFILILILPYIFLNSQLTDQINKGLETGEYASSMHLIGCYYDEDIAYFYEDKEKDVQLVLFRATPFTDTTYTKVDESGKETQVITEETINLGYFGFLCNVSDKYNVSSTKEKEDFENKTKLIVNNNINIFLLDYDENNDTKADSILTLLSGSYVSFAITIDDVKEIEKLDFIDKDGNTFLTVSINDSTYGKLDFSHKFFDVFNNFIGKYNKLIEDKTLGVLSDEEITSRRLELEEIVSKIFEEDSSYKVGSYAVSIKAAKVKAYTISAIYFVGILIIGDLIVGRKIIIELIKRFIGLFTKKNS